MSTPKKANGRDGAELVWAWDGALVRAAREATPSRFSDDKTMSVAEVAAAMGVEKPTVWKWEVDLETRRKPGRRGNTCPSGSDIGRLASLYGVKPSDFYRFAPVVK